MTSEAEQNEVFLPPIILMQIDRCTQLLGSGDSAPLALELRKARKLMITDRERAPEALVRAATSHDWATIGLSPDVDAKVGQLLHRLSALGLVMGTHGDCVSPAALDGVVRVSELTDSGRRELAFEDEPGSVIVQHFVTAGAQPEGGGEPAVDDETTMQDERILGGPEDGRRLASDGLTVMDTGIAAATDPDPDSSREMAVGQDVPSHSVGRSSARTGAPAEAVASPGAGASANADNAVSSVAQEEAALRDCEMAALVQRVRALGEGEDRHQARSRLVDYIWSRERLEARREALAVLEEFSRFDDAWDRQQTQKTLALHVRTTPTDPLNREIIATANAIVNLTREESNDRLRGKFSPPSTGIPPIVWPFLAAIVAIFVAALTASVAGGLVGLMVGVLAWWLVMWLLNWLAFGK